MLTLLILVALWGVVFAWIFLFRNTEVYYFRKKMIDVVYQYPWSPDIELMRSEYQSVSHERMMWMFWKPLESFYAGTKLLEKHHEQLSKTTSPK